MKIISATADANVAGFSFRRGQRYVAGDYVAGALCNAAPALLRTVADATVYSRPWRGEPLDNKRLLIYRPLGIGDEFIVARLATHIASNCNPARVGLALYESHHNFWAGTPNLPFQLFPSIIQWEDWQSSHYHVLGEHWWETLATTDQPDIWEIMERVCNITLCNRTPFLPTVPAEILAKTAATIEHFITDRPVILWQLAATSRIRSYPPEQTRAAMRLALANTNAVIIACGHPAQVSEYELEESDRLSIYSAGIPGLLALVAAIATRGNALVICPDSVLGHIAACYPEIPVVSLWSAFDPRVRVAAYPNHRPIYNKIRCSPCWSHEHTGDPAQYKGCPLTACNDHCAGLRTIKPKTVLDSILALLPVPAAAQVAPSLSPVAAAAKAVDLPVAAAAKAVDSPSPSSSPLSASSAPPREPSSSPLSASSAPPREPSSSPLSASSAPPREPSASLSSPESHP